MCLIQVFYCFYYFIVNEVAILAFYAFVYAYIWAYMHMIGLNRFYMCLIQILLFYCKQGSRSSNLYICICVYLYVYAYAWS